MKYSLVTRDLIADSTECMAKAHQFDALVMIPNCDKNVPGLINGCSKSKCANSICFRRTNACRTCWMDIRRSLSSMFEAVGANAAGTDDS